MSGKDYSIKNCQLCERTVALTFHHLIPKKLHRRKHFKTHFSKERLNEGIMLCRRCHRGIHKLFDEMTLGKQYNSLDSLKTNPDVARHVEWVRKQKESNQMP